MKLKNYKSCADCRRYELAGFAEDGRCQLGFPLQQLDKPIVRTTRDGAQEIEFNHKPKYGCVQKDYYGAPDFDDKLAMEKAFELSSQ